MRRFAVIGLAGMLSLCLHSDGATVPVVNVSPFATQSGLNPDATLNQGNFATSSPGKTRGTFDRDMFGWTGNVTSPRRDGSRLSPRSVTSTGWS